ncbi:MAG: accessory gene regulator B family protein [Lachnospiraceae bacterium]|nr:accessory gene regulator B family protein [Lachnospiraceae bacterium]
MSGWLSRRMVERNIIGEEEQGIYQFGVRNGIIILINITTAFLIGLFTEQLLVVYIFTLSFMMLRSFTGGYHCDSSLWCYISSSFVLFIPVNTVSLFVRMSVMSVLLILAAVAGVIIVLSPMHSKKRKLDYAEKKHFGRRARVMVILQAAVFLMLWYLGYNGYAYAVYSSICIIAVLMLAGKAQLYIQLHMEK